MSDYLLGSALYFQRVVDPKDGLALIRRMLDRLGEYRGAPLRPTSSEQNAMLHTMDVTEFESSGYLVTTSHQVLAAELARPSFPVNITYVEPGRNITQIQIFVAIMLNPTELAQVWHYVLDWMPLFVEATDASLAVLNAIPDTNQHPDYLPDEDEVRPREWPPFFGPWNYLGPDRLNGRRREFLRSLPGVHSAAFKEGWILQVVSELVEGPSSEFLEVLKNIPGAAGVEYRQPVISG